MLFGRRQPPKVGERVRVFVWPRRSWGRSIRYVTHRLRRLHATPHAVALGSAVGVFVTFLPFLGLHIVLAGILSWMIRGSILASALGTFVGNPITFPFIWVAAYHVGCWVLGLEPTVQPFDLSAGSLQASVESVWPLLKPITVGGLPLGMLAGVMTYFVVRRAAEAYRNKQHDRPSTSGQHPASTAT